MKTEHPFWHKFTVEIIPQFEAEASARLVALGSNGVWVEEENDSIFLNVFFPGTLPKAPLLEFIRSALKPFAREKGLPISTEFLKEEDWQTQWQRHSVPVQKIGKKLQIVPPWEISVRFHLEREVLRLSPGMAFGTGTHPTTRSCLIFLEEVIPKNPKGPLLDVGTGSGVLSIAAVKLGVKRVTAVEIDPVALSVAKENARANSVLSQITFRNSMSPRGNYAVAVANLTAPLLLEFERALTRAVSSGGKIILSGMLKGPHLEIISRYRKFFRPISTKTKEGWVTLLMKRK